MRQIFNFGNGEVGVGSGKAADCRSVVVLKYLEPGKYKTGDPINENFEDNNDVVMYFSSVESIDVLIKHCKQAKEILKREMLNNQNDEYNYGHTKLKDYGTDY